MMEFYIWVFLVFMLCVYSFILVKNDNCIYLFDMERNFIKVICFKNVIVIICGKGNIKLLIGNDLVMWYWFEVN